MYLVFYAVAVHNIISTSKLLRDNNNNNNHFIHYTGQPALAGTTS